MPTGRRWFDSRCRWAHEKGKLKPYSPAIIHMDQFLSWTVHTAASIRLPVPVQRKLQSRRLMPASHLQMHAFEVPLQSSRSTREPAGTVGLQEAARWWGLFMCPWAPLSWPSSKMVRRHGLSVNPWAISLKERANCLDGWQAAHKVCASAIRHASLQRHSNAQASVWCGGHCVHQADAAFY